MTERERDRELADGIIRGDQAALEAVIEQYESRVFALALNVVGDRGAAEDIAQDVFVRLWQHPGDYDPARGSLQAWLLCIAHSRAVDWIRSESAHRNRDTRVERMSVDNGLGIDEVVVRSDIGRAVRDALATLPPAQRNAIVLAYFDGLTYRQVAVRTGLPEGTAKSQIRLGLRQLACLLGTSQRLVLS